MPPKKSTNVQAICEAQLGKILGDLQKEVRNAMSSEELSDRTRKRMERAIVLSQKAIEKQPGFLCSKRKSTAKPPRKRSHASKAQRS
jgi:hypothetical protein